VAGGAGSFERLAQINQSFAIDMEFAKTARGGKRKI
jgi:hypothetical protein